MIFWQLDQPASAAARIAAANATTTAKRNDKQPGPHVIVTGLYGSFKFIGPPFPLTLPTPSFPLALPTIR